MSDVPSPIVKVRSPISAAFKLKSPLVTVICTCRLPAPTSTSLMNRRLLLAALKVRRASSSTDWSVLPGTAVSCSLMPPVSMLFTGGSLTGLTMISTVSTSVRIPPAPKLPLSSVVMVRDTVPLKCSTGVKTAPSSRALMEAIEPLRLWLACVTALIVSVPESTPITRSQTLVPCPSSGSLMKRRLPLPLLNVKVVSSSIV